MPASEWWFVWPGGQPRWCPACRVRVLPDRATPLCPRCDAEASAATLTDHDVTLLLR